MKAFFARPIVKWILWITGIILLILIIYYIYKRVSKITIMEDIRAQAQRDLPGTISKLEAQRVLYSDKLAGMGNRPGATGVYVEDKDWYPEMGGKHVKTNVHSFSKGELTAVCSLLTNIINDLRKGII